MKKLLFVMNPYAGMRRANRFLTDILSLFNGRGYEVTVHMTAGPGDGARAVEAMAGRADLVVCAGGDGTFNETVTGLLRSGLDLPLGYIPCGSTNDFANSLKLPTNVLQAAQVIVDGDPVPYDVGRFGDRYFSYVASFGAFTKASYSTPQSVKNALGHVAYVLQGAKELFQIPKEHVAFQTDSGSFEGDYIFGAISNSTSVGGFKGMTGKDVLLDDGVFEVTLIKKPKNPIELNEIIASLINLVDDTDMIYSFKTSEVRFTAKNTIPWTLDGEFGGDHEEVVVKNLCRAVEIMVPQGE